MRTTAIIFNKAWELEPALAAMCSPEFRPANLPFPSSLLPLKDRRPSSVYSSTDPRAVFSFHEKGDSSLPVTYEVRIWCIQDLMDKNINSSDSCEKYRVLPPVLTGYKPDLVIAVGTAGSPLPGPIAGCVVAGPRFFLHDGHPGNTSHLDRTDYETLLPANVNPELLNLISPSFKQLTEPKFIPPPNNPCLRPAFLASNYYTAVSSFNVLDYGEYAWVDSDAAAAFRKIEPNLPIGSIDTTQTIIRVSSEAPCCFVSAITDVEGRFDMEVTNPQNYICSFNAGLVLGQFLVSINDLLQQKPGYSFRIN